MKNKNTNDFLQNLYSNLKSKIDNNIAVRLLASKIQSFENWMQVEIADWMLKENSDLRIELEKKGVDIWTKQYAIECKIIQSDWSRLGGDIEKLSKFSTRISEEYLVVFLFFSKTTIKEEKIMEQTQVYFEKAKLILLEFFEVEPFTGKDLITFGCFGVLKVKISEPN